MLLSPIVTPPPAAPMNLEPAPQQAVEQLTTLLPKLEDAVGRHKVAIAGERLDRTAVRDMAAAGRHITDALHELSVGRWQQLEQRRELARTFAERYSRAIADLPGMWALPTELMKPLFNVSQGAERLGEAIARQDLDLSMSSDAHGLNQAANGLRAIEARQFATNSTAVDGSGFRIVGLARMANDAVLRLRNGIQASTNERPFRSDIQASVAVEALRDVLADGADVVPTAIAAQLASALDAARGTYDRDGRGFPAGPEAYATAMSVVERAALTTQGVLDSAAAPFLALPGTEGETFRGWRQVQRGQDGSYHDDDIGW